jgi:L-ascorbate metabolism protein UlaG (beta-lactamase superfamily)
MDTGTSQTAGPDTDTPSLDRGSILFIGTATVLIRYLGFTILTDPNFVHQGGRVPLGYGLHSTRKTDPALNLEQLPPLDMVVLSHLHGDHFDQVVERRLDRRIPIVTTRQAAGALTRKGFRTVHGLATWKARTFAKGDARLRVTAMPGKHGPGLLNALLPSVMGSMLDFESRSIPGRLRLYITGDTLIYDRLAEIPRRYPDIDVALLHLGGTRLLGIMLTMDAEQGVRMLQIAQPRTAIPIHFNDYPVFKSPLGDFRKAVAAAKLEERVRYLRHGDTYTFEVPASA